MKRTFIMLLCLVLAMGISAQDKKIAIKSITASSYQPGDDPRYAIDGNINTIWHSTWENTAFPVTVELTLNETTHIDYIRYTPRQDGSTNGHWGDVTLEYAAATDTDTFQKIGEYKLNGSASVHDFILPDSGLDIGKIRFIIKSGHNDFTSAAEIEAYEYGKDNREQIFRKYFEDDLYTVLKEDVTSSDSIEDEEIKKLVGNLLSDAGRYKKFRVGEYEPYLKTSTVRHMLKTSSYYNNYENPTGIYLKRGESCTVIVSGIGQYAVGLQIKSWGASERRSTYQLKNGLNHITAITEGNVFVNYYTDELENVPNVKVHFVNARVQGYWDQETMDNNDWTQLLKGRSGSDETILITRSKHAQLAYPVSAWLQYNRTNIDSVMTLYEQVQWAQRNMMGLEKYGRQVKNRQLFYATEYGFLAATDEGAMANIETLGDLTCPDAAKFSFWAVGHEWGHNNQINGFSWSGCGETTNNIYASWGQYLFTGNRSNLTLEDEKTGVGEYAGMRGGRMEVYFEEGLRKGVQWQLQDGPDYNGSTPQTITVRGEDAEGNSIGNVTTTSRNYDHFVKVVPFWQLNLWGTVAGKCPDIIPMTIEAIRADSEYEERYNTNGKQQMNWMKLACDSARLNLLPFFERAGMLRPINAYIEDYGAGWNIITEGMIDRLKEHVAKMGYPTPDEEINFINANNMHIYRDKLKLEVPATLGTGCTYKNGKVTVKHSAVKNAVAFETYNAAGELMRITMYGLGSDNAHSYTQVLYPGGGDEETASAYIMAVGYDSTRVKIYEKTNIVKTMTANRYYRITLPSRGNTALSCGANTSVDAEGNITWNLERSAKSNSKADQIWMWEKRGKDTYLYNPQSGHYFGGTSGSQTTHLYTQADAPAWEASCVDENKNKYTFNLKGSGNYMNGYSNTETGMWTDGAGDPNNIWTVEEVTTFSITIPVNKYIAACYPFTLETPEGVTAYVVSGYGKYNYEGADYDYALLEEIDGNIVPANTPVIYSGEKGTYTMNIVAEDSTVVTKANMLKGTTLKRTLEAGTFLATMAMSTVAGTTASINGTATDTQVAANRGYLLKKNVGDASQLYLGVKSVVTGIGNIEAEDSEAKLYNVDGTTATELESGKIYITSDGKKILVK